MISLDDVELPNGLQWENEFGWSQIEQSSEYSLDGALHIQQGVKQAGREIKLHGGGGGAWITREKLLELYALANVADKVMTLTLWGRTFNVMFKQPDSIEAEEIMRVADPDNERFYSITVNLFEVA